MPRSLGPLSRSSQESTTSTVDGRAIGPRYSQGTAESLLTSFGPGFGGRADVPYWYQQNPLLYLEAEKAAELGYDLAPPAMLDVAHPEMIQFFEWCAQ